MIALALRGIRFHWRSYIGLLIGATVATAILVGALAVGDSVRQSLRAMALSRLGSIQLALNGQSRFLRAELADRLSSDLEAPAAPVMLLRGTASKQSDQGESRAGHVQVVGVTDSFWRMAASVKGHASGADGDAVRVNEPLARKLGLKAGDDLLLRIEKPSLLSRDAPLSTVEDASVPLRLTVSGIVSDALGGRFSLAANQLPPLTAFVPLKTLQKAVGMQGRANAILVGRSGRAPQPEDATRSLWKHWDFADAGLELRTVAGKGAVELRTDRVFLDPPVADAALKALPGAQGVLTYFVNELRVGSRTTPYSVVSGMQGGPVPAAMKDDEALINQWLADDLGAKPGDRVKLSYWVVGPMRKLVTQSSEFRIRAVLPLSGDAADPDLMPDIPGLSDKKNCREWEPGVPIQLDKIRDKDQDYWSKHRGTPKAFLTLAAAQKIWNNRFGNLTAVRYSTSGSPQSASGNRQPADRGPNDSTTQPPNDSTTQPPNDPATHSRIEACIRQSLSPASMGIYFAPVREQALTASATALDFGQLFVAFSFFLVVSALILTALLFGFAVEQRAEETGTLLSMGFRPALVRRLFLLEALAPMAVAAAVGSALGALYTKAIVYSLNTVWRNAVAGASLTYSVELKTLGSGAASGFLTALFAVWLVTRRQARAPIRELLSAGAETEMRSSTARPGRLLPGSVTAAITLLGGIAALAATVGKGQQEAAGLFFLGGMLLLIAGIAACRTLLARMARRASATHLTIRSLGIRGAARRYGRSLAAIALLASGSFMVVAVGANRQDVTATADRKDSGTGGFTFYGETTLPIHEDLNTPEGQEANSLDPGELAGVSVVAMRLREGDEASCLNLNRAQSPRLFGVQPAALAGRFSFSKVADQRFASDPWSALESVQSNGAIPVIGDTNTVVWSLGKGLGDTLDYVDERGLTRKLRIVGITGNSILQGGLVIHENDFIRLFPSLSGYQVFLATAPQTRTHHVRAELTRGLEFQGLDIVSSADRLAAFHTVEETYLSIFAALGGLGLLLGSAGLGVIVLRNVLERRGELALLRAVGFRPDALRSLVFAEHSLLLLLGLLVGVISALAAVVPTLTTAGAGPVLPVAVTLGAVLVSGLLWTWLATLAALRGPLLHALRNE